MARSCPIVLPLLLGCLAAPVVAQPVAPPVAKRPISVDDRTRLREVSDPQRSPDGLWVAFTVGIVRCGEGHP